ncbi:MAG: hypothetical protein ACI8QZ_004120 [Chlamydiales bacterium]
MTGRRHGHQSDRDRAQHSRRGDLASSRAIHVSGAKLIAQAAACIGNGVARNADLGDGQVYGQHGPGAPQSPTVPLELATRAGPLQYLTGFQALELQCAQSVHWKRWVLGIVLLDRGHLASVHHDLQDPIFPYPRAGSARAPWSRFQGIRARRSTRHVRYLETADRAGS